MLSLPAVPPCVLLAALAYLPSCLVPLVRACTLNLLPPLVTSHFPGYPSHPSLSLAGGFPGHSLLFFAASLGVVACGIVLFTLSGDVEAQLGAGSARAAAATGSGLPVAYHRVAGGGGGPGALGKNPQEAIEEMQRQHQYLREAPPAALPNPFALGHEGPLGGGSSSRADGGGGPAFMPLPAADDGWLAPSQTGLGSGGTSPLSIEVPAAAAAAMAAAAAGTAAGTTPTSPAPASEGTPHSLRHASFDVDQ